MRYNEKLVRISNSPLVGYYRANHEGYKENGHGDTIEKAKQELKRMMKDFTACKKCKKIDNVHQSWHDIILEEEDACITIQILFCKTCRSTRIIYKD